jgi:hypothetical protein
VPWRAGVCFLGLSRPPSPLGTDCCDMPAEIAEYHARLADTDAERRSAELEVAARALAAAHRGRAPADQLLITRHREQRTDRDAQTFVEMAERAERGSVAPCSSSRGSAGGSAGTRSVPMIATAGSGRIAASEKRSGASSMAIRLSWDATGADASRSVAQGSCSRRPKRRLAGDG